VVGAIALLILIFSTEWVVTSGSAKTKAEEMAKDSVVNRLSAICVEQFLKDPKMEDRLKEFKKIDYWATWERAEFVKKQGWATMPGEKEPDSKVAEACAIRIGELIK